MTKALDEINAKRKHNDEAGIQAMLAEVETHRLAAKKAQKEASKQKERASAAEASKSELEASLGEQMAQYESRMNALLDAACTNEGSTKTLMI